MADVLKGKKVAILAADMFERVELEEPRKALEDAGAEVEIVSIHDGEIQGFDHFEPANTVQVDRTVEEVSPDDYDALLVPGGVGNPDQLRGDENAVAFVRGFHDAGKPMAVICHGPWVLVESGVVRGRRSPRGRRSRPTSATPAATGSTTRSSSTATSSRAGSRTTSRPSTERCSGSSPGSVCRAELVRNGAATRPRCLEVADGTRTRDHRDHNPELYQLSYRHRAGTD